MFFDVGETLVHMPPWHDRLVRALAGLGLEVEDERIRAAVDAGDRWLAARPHQDLLPTYAAEERRTLDHLAVIARTLAVPGLDVRYLRDTCYYIAAAELFPDAPTAVRAVRHLGMATGVISNAPPSARALLVRTGLAGLFDTITLSSDVGVMKPGAAIYAAALDRAGVEPEYAGFVDDVPENIDGARAIGFASLFVVDRAGHARGRADRIPDLSSLAGRLGAACTGRSSRSGGD
jgi:HAD superfamily hydrolase (TIGR01509 family)